MSRLCVGFGPVRVKQPASLFQVVLAVGLVSTFALPSHADFLEPVSWERGEGGATWQHWDVFDDIPDDTPDVGFINPNGHPSVNELTGSAFITSSGNIYNFVDPPTSFEVTIPELDVPSPLHDVTAIVQIRTQGFELDLSSLSMNGLAPVATAELERISLGPPQQGGGEQVDTWFLFNVPYSDFGDGVAGVEHLTLLFEAEQASMVLDQISIDTAIRPFGFYDEPTPNLGNTPGDANGDGAVDLLDLDILGTNWQQTGDFADGDFNGDGQIDLLDLDILGANWGAGTAGDAGPFASALASSALPVPEPTTSLALAVTLTGWLSRRRRI